MCGITGIVLKTNSGIELSETVAAMNAAIEHRGPDGDGFISAGSNFIIPQLGNHSHNTQNTRLPYTPKQLLSPIPNAFLCFGHRRLSIIDLSEKGHQPMCSNNEKTWITFNGEIYNYIELREELQKKGYSFVSESDTEVVLIAYQEWGFNCVQKFNGMWAFCIYDSEQQLCFASRDRLGVKPFYYINHAGYFAFASEQKAFVKAKLITAQVSKKNLHSYLVNGTTENEITNFFTNVVELWPGTNLIYSLKNQELQQLPYYHLSERINLVNNNLDLKQLIRKIEYQLEQAVKLRLRSDVEVGTCLSGGIDSSVLAVLIAELSAKPLSCFTSVFKNESFNEERYADTVVKKIKGQHFKIEATLTGFLEEVDSLVYSQDVPIWDTSTYAQYKVMELAKLKGIKVVLDGQGADELFGGYHHHFIAKWKQLVSQKNVLGLISDMRSSAKTISQPFSFFAKETIKQKFHLRTGVYDLFFTKDFLNSNKITNPVVYKKNVNEQLLHDIYTSRLKSFLKCEDRCGMWHGVESRTPFSDDVDLIELLFSFDGLKKIQNGVSKYLLREATKEKLPIEIYSRYDKKGFETPMQKWTITMRNEMLKVIQESDFDFVNYKGLSSSNPQNIQHNKLIFKLYILSKWHKVF